MRTATKTSPSRTMASQADWLSAINESPIRIWMAAAPAVGVVGRTRIMFVLAISTATGWTSIPCTKLAVMSA